MPSSLDGLNTSSANAPVASKGEGHWIANLFRPAEIDPRQRAISQLEATGMPFTGDGLVRTVSTGHRPLINLFEAAGMDINTPAANGRTALLTAALIKDWPLVEHFLQSHARADVADQRGLTPLMAAAMADHLPTLRELLAAGAPINAADEYGHTALHYAVVTRSIASMRALLDAGANTVGACCEDHDLLSHAMETQDWRIVEPILTRHPADLTWNSFTRHELTQAISRQDSPKTRLLLSKHPAPPTPEGKAQPLLGHALLAGDMTTFKFLLDCGADPNTQLGSPVEKDFSRSVKTDFLRHYLDTEPGMTVLMLAAGMGRADFVQTLLSKGASRGIGTKNYKMPALLFAARREDPDVMQMLISGAPKPEQFRIEISLGSQRAEVIKDGVTIFTTSVSTGKPGHATPSGRFIITDKHRTHRSTIYPADMPFFMRLNCRDFGMHQGNVPGYPASHGCIRLPGGSAQKLFKEVPTGTLVTIQ